MINNPRNIENSGIKSSAAEPGKSRARDAEPSNSRVACAESGVNGMGGFGPGNDRCEGSVPDISRLRKCRRDSSGFSYFIAAALTMIAVICLATACGGRASSQDSAAYVSETMPQTSRAPMAETYAAAGAAGEYGMEPAEAEVAEENYFAAENVMTAGGSDGGSLGYSVQSEAPASEMPADGTATNTGTAADTAKTDQRKLIRNIDIEMETRKFDELVATIRSKVQELGGYTDSVSISGNAAKASSKRNAYITARIPAERTDEFLNTALSEGSINYMSESTEDITLKYVDMEAKKKSLRVEQERLTELLAEAESVESVIAIETRLSEVRYELESIESRLRTYDNQVDYSTVTINVSEVRVISETPESSFTDRIKAGLARNIINIGNFVENSVIDLISSLPTIALLAIICIIIYAIAKRIIRKRGFGVNGIKNKDKRRTRQRRNAENRHQDAERTAAESDKSPRPAERKTQQGESGSRASDIDQNDAGQMPDGAEPRGDAVKNLQEAQINGSADNENVNDEGGKA